MSVAGASLASLLVATLFGLPAERGKPPPAAPIVRVQAAAPTTPPPLSAFKRGIRFADWRGFDGPRGGLYAPGAVDRSLPALARTGANWIALVVACWQEKVDSTVISCGPPRTATDDELRYVVKRAHDLGLRVLLKPQLDLSKEVNPGVFRGSIGTAFKKEDQWQAWFKSYRDFIGHYAVFSASAGVDMLSVGVELGSTTGREADWRGTIAEIRKAFPGPLTYASLSSTGNPPPHGEEARIKWWDAVDFIGVDAYYPLATKTNPTVAEMKAAWTQKGYLVLLEKLSKKFSKPVLFTEVGFRSADGAARVPGAYRDQPPLDLQEQADAYEATLDVLWDKPWFGGFFWWQWAAGPTGGPTDASFTPYGKPAEQVLSKYYHRP